MIKYLYFLISYVTPTKFSDRSTTTAWCDRNRKGQTDGDINKVFMFCPSRLYDLLPLSRINVNAYLAKSRVKPHNTHFVLCGLKYWGWYDTCVSDRERIRSCQFFGMDKIQRNLSCLIFFDSIANILRLGRAFILVCLKMMNPIIDGVRKSVNIFITAFSQLNLFDIKQVLPLTIY